MRTVSIYELRKNLASYIEEVSRDSSTLLVNRFGKATVVISPYKNEVEDFKKYFGFLKGRETGTEFENRVRRNKREKTYVENLRRGKKH